jgi:hypothetical protein
VKRRARKPTTEIIELIQKNLVVKQATAASIIFALAFTVLSGGEALEQADPQNYLFNTGQTVQPYFEGWSHNSDGSFEMHFGYLNRNYVDPVHVPVGSNNRFNSDPVDQGQPTFFYPRVNRRVFSVTVPETFGEQEVVWSITIDTETNHAVGWLQAEWEINIAPRIGLYAEETAGQLNQAPELIVRDVDTVTLPATLSLTALISDDGLPEPRQRNSGTSVVLPTFEPEGPTVPTNVPQIQSSNRLRPTRMTVENVSVIWTQWRGAPSEIQESLDEAQPDHATVSVTFQTPGDYLFRIQASDGLETVTKDLSITVQ